MITVYEITGPECPKCGCKDGAELKRDDKYAWRQCRYCNKTWRIKIDAVEESPIQRIVEAIADTVAPKSADVVYPVLHCPHCDSTDTVITSTKKPKRKHKCRACGRAFKSVEG